MMDDGQGHCPGRGLILCTLPPHSRGVSSEKSTLKANAGCTLPAEWGPEFDNHKSTLPNTVGPESPEAARYGRPIKALSDGRGHASNLVVAHSHPALAPEPPPTLLCKPVKHSVGGSHSARGTGGDNALKWGTYVGVKGTDTWDEPIIQSVQSR